MGVAELVGIMAVVGGSVWAIAEKIGNLHKCLDKRLDDLRDRQIEIEHMVTRNRDKIDAAEVANRAWFAKIHKDLYRCTIPPTELSEGLSKD